MSRAPFVLLAVGLVLGAAYDRLPTRPVVTRAGYRVLAGDFHAHTRFSDGFLGPWDLVLHARRRGLDVVGVTEHNQVFPGKLARAFSRAIGGPTVVVGEEITFKEFHLIALGLDRRIAPDADVPTLVDRVHGQGGVAIAAHPAKQFWSAYEAARPMLDGTELMHPVAYADPAGNRGFRWADMREFYVRAHAEGLRMTPIGSSDYHGFSPLGLCRTYVFATRDDEVAVVDAIREGRTVVYDLSGKAWGRPDLVAALEKEPLPERSTPIDDGYRAHGLLDALGRICGLLGALGLVVFGRKRPVEGPTA